MLQQYELVDGKHPERERALKRDDGRAFTGWEDDPRESIHRAVAAAVDAGVIRNRDDVVRMLEQSDFDVPRLGKDHLTVRNPDDGRRVRMRGDFVESHSDRWKQFEERVKSESERIEKAQESAFEELSKRLSERASAALVSTESAIDETVIVLRERIREQIQQGSEGIPRAVAEAMAEASSR